MMKTDSVFVNLQRNLCINTLIRGFRRLKVIVTSKTLRENEKSKLRGTVSNYGRKYHQFIGYLAELLLKQAYIHHFEKFHRLFIATTTLQRPRKGPAVEEMLPQGPLWKSRHQRVTLRKDPVNRTSLPDELLPEKMVGWLFTLLSVIVVLLQPGRAKTVQGSGGPGDACEMGGGVMGTCEEVEACIQDGGVVQRMNIVKLCTPRNPKIYVCCRKPLRIADELCAAWAKYWRTGGGECVKENRLIVGGVSAKLGEFPHIAILGFQEGNLKIGWDCGGTLISPHFVLTAAHCTQRNNQGQYWVMLGEHDRNYNATMDPWPKLQGPIPPSLFRSSELAKDSSETAPVEQLLRVEEVIDYPEYNGYLTYYDISLLRLSKPAVLTSRVLPACLPIKNDYVVKEELTVAGWGRTSFGAQESSLILQKVNVPVVGLLECQFRLFRHQDLFRAPKGIMVDQLCAGEEGRDSCRGDSGGPLIDQVSRGGSKCEHTVVGVVSFGRGCGELGVYTRVSAYIDWITGYIAPN